MLSHRAFFVSALLLFGPACANDEAQPGAVASSASGSSAVSNGSAGSSVGSGGTGGGATSGNSGVGGGLGGSGGGGAQGGSGGGPAATVLYTAGPGLATNVALDAMTVFVGGGFSIDGQITVVPKDGSAPAILATGQEAVRGIAVDDAFVYWTGSPLDSPGVVKRIAKSGGIPETLVTSADSPWAVAIDSANLYWTERPVGGGAGGVFKLPLSGGPPVALSGAQCDPASIAIDLTQVYWTNYNCADGNVSKAAIAGGPSELVAHVSSASSLTVSGGLVYWSYWPVHALSRAPVGGGSMETFGPDLGYVQGMAADASAVYFGMEGIGGLEGRMMRLDLGSDTPILLASGFSMPEIGFVNIGVDATHVYFATGAELLRAPK